ncbi:hypothetical protein PPERSA_01202 [Pseudocohnilembus persalinus]|uniref:Uncharacterized protein n=1 Tax=Pseudocohnilembus persalinus TaxID=266149 RepID=A0A0V0QBY0_PSEPJ|nr:hypothetical protein PPERSA_01202 [Pseudocohnilembus persalinus]|eukprot:KRW99556.1 hypothetical protein PPERSA_01202 [Pseudocohnilembus persalinus]
MECQDFTKIIKNPDGSIQIATQPHLKGQKQLKCYQCQQIIVFKENAAQIKCTNCQALNGIPGQQNNKPKYLRCSHCNTQNEVMRIDGNLVSICVNCETFTAAR